MKTNIMGPPTIAGDLFEEHEGKVALTLAECTRCSSRWFPARDVCARCGSRDLVVKQSGPRGIAYASTVVRVGAGVFPKEYVLSYIDVDGVRVLAHTEGTQALVPGTPIELVFGPVAMGDEGAIYSYVARSAVGEVAA